MIEFVNKDSCIEDCVPCVCGASSGMIKEGCIECYDGGAGCLRDRNTMRILDEVESIEDLPKIDLSEGGDFLISLNINGIDIVQDCGIDSEMVMKVLRMLGYGNIGWERYNVVNPTDKQDKRKVGVLNNGGTIYITLPKDFAKKEDWVNVESVGDKELKITY